MSREQNPIMVLATSRARWLSPRASFYAAFGLGLTSLVLSTLAVILAPYAVQEAMFVPWVITYGLIVITPLIAAISAGMLAVESRADPMLMLTPLTPMRWVMGHISAAIYRVRLLLILLITLLAPSVIGAMYLSIQLAVIFATVMCSGACASGETLESQRPDMIAAGFSQLWLCLMVALAILVAAAVGVLIARMTRQRSIAALGSPIVFTIVMVVAIGGWTTISSAFNGWVIEYAVPPLTLAAIFAITVAAAAGDPDRIADIPASQSSDMRQ